MKFILNTFLFLLLSINAVWAQYAPQAGVTGSTAIHKSSTLFKEWVNQCTVNRGLQYIADPSLGYTTVGNNLSAYGIADGEVVSLGDSGVAIVSFAQPLYDGIGADFAVFENGFQNPANKEESFMELAFVEVSSDGNNFFRFPCISNTSTGIQVKGAGDYLDARKVNNLAGKYIAQYGTPFDLEVLKGTSGLDVNHITHIKIIDVIGSIDDRSSIDNSGQKINDPYPTPYPSGGFDLDAVGAINIKTTGINDQALVHANLFPNPATTRIQVQIRSLENKEYQLEVIDGIGRILSSQKAQLVNIINIENLVTGTYSIVLATTSEKKWIGKFCKL